MKEVKLTKYLVVFIALVVLFLIAAGIALIMYFTNNLSTDLTTFYVQYGAQEIRRDTGRMQFEKGVYYTFRCEYPIGFPGNEKGERYTVSVEVNEAGKEIDYFVDEIYTYLYPKSPDVTQSFDIQKDKDSFTFRIPAETTFKSILTKAYEGKEVKNVPVVDLLAKDYFSLVVKSYDGGTVIRIGFGFDGKAEDTESPNPDVPAPDGYFKISYQIYGDDTVSEAEWNNCIVIKSERYALPNTAQTVEIKVANGYQNFIAIQNLYVRSADGVSSERLIPDSNSEGTYTFTMPDFDVIITIYAGSVFS